MTASFRRRRRRSCTTHVGATNKTLKIFDAEEGAAEHCQVDDRQAGVNYIADWITENVVRG